VVVGLLVVSSSETKKEPMPLLAGAKVCIVAIARKQSLSMSSFLAEILLLHDGGIIYVTLRNQKDQQISV